MSPKACAGILRRAEKRGKELPPVLREALEIQAGLRETADKPQPDEPVAFACNQQDEVRDLRDVSGAVQAQPGMKQQTFVAGLVTKGDGDCILTPDRHTTLSGGGGQAGQGYPCVVTAGFCVGASPTAGTIGWQEECSPTLKSVNGGNMVPGICVPRPAQNGLTPWEAQQKRIFTDDGASPTLTGCDGKGGRTPGGLIFTPQCVPEVARALTARHDSSPCADRGQNFVAVFDNYGPDGRHTGPVKTAQTLTKYLGTGGNNTPLAVLESPVYCIMGNAVDRQPHNGGNGIGIQTGAAYTVTATDRHCVAFSMQRSDTYCENDVTMTQSARQHKGPTDLVCQPEVVGLGSRNMKENGDICGTLQEKPDGGQSLNSTHPVSVGMVVRRLTPLECEKLQGYPDGWTNLPGASDSARYRALGNSVAIPCVEFVMRGIALLVDCNYG